MSKTDSSHSINRCLWCLGSDLMIEYHDREWGSPLHDEGKHFEFLLLEFFQAGLSWSTILNKRENFRRAFDNFDVETVAGYGPAKISKLLENPGIIRNKLKVNAAVNNAKKFIEVQKEFGSFDAYIWHFTDGKPVVNSWKVFNEIPVTTSLSDAVSKDLKKRGFSFVGSTTIYAHLQAIGVVNDHLVSCYRHLECRG